MAKDKNTEKMSDAALAAAIIITALTVYYHAYGLFASAGLACRFMDSVLDDLSFALGDAAGMKLTSVLFVSLSCMMRVGRRTELSWAVIAALLLPGLALYFWMPQSGALLAAANVTGFVLVAVALSLARRKFGLGGADMETDLDETFLQNEKVVRHRKTGRISPYGIYFDTVYKYQGRVRHGKVCVVSPQRGNLILGLPGSGKSYAIYGEYIRQSIKAGYTMFVYDYKYPDLSRDVYNIWLQNRDIYRKLYGVDAEFYVVNFDNPRYSHRCNPIHPRYITDPADATEIAELVMLNINKAAIGKEDFFSMSAKVYLDCIVYWLYLYDLKRGGRGRYCSFPYVIEMMSRNYEDVLYILAAEPKLAAKITSFKDALEAEAQDQLQGQIASARIPLAKFVSPQLYYVLSGDDFDLKVNDPLHPKILCVGNNPDRDTINGATLALLTSRMFKLINHPGCPPSMVMVDEFPTVYLKGIDKVIATARSNRVSVVLGAQDKGQIERDYSHDEAKVIFDTCANIFSGAVQGETAQEFNRSFGREKRRQESRSQSESGESVSVSWHDEDRLPIQKIANLSVGEFFGKVGDDADYPILRKDFCAKFVIDSRKRAEERKHYVPMPVIRAAEFGEERIVEEIESDGGRMAIDYYAGIEKEKFQQERETYYMQHIDRMPSPADMQREIEKHRDDYVNRMSEEERRRLVEEFKERCLKANADERIEKAYRDIVADVDSIIETAPRWTRDMQVEGLVSDPILEYCARYRVDNNMAA